MIPFLQFHALAATRGEGLRPELTDPVGHGDDSRR
jgi:hypothetical protein